MKIENFKLKIFRLWPLLALLCLVLILFFTNYRPGTILSGWDNLHPEYNFPLNINRSIFSVWQEYQGLGLLAGMAHSTDLFRQIFLLSLSYLFPSDLLRYLWTFFMLFAGASGAYFLIKNLIISNAHESRIKNQESRERKTIIHDSYFMIPFLGGSFYLLNLATMQTFYAPFEPFITFHGALPWLLWACLRYVNGRGTMHCAPTGFLILVLLLSTPAWYLQTLFIVFIMTLTIILMPSVIGSQFSVVRNKLTSFQATGQTNRKLEDSYPKTENRKLITELSESQHPKLKQKNIVWQLVKLYTIIFLINSFWLLPATYFSLTNTHINLDAKINQMATEDIFLRNKEFGDLGNTTLLRGFWFNNVDPDSSGTMAYMLKPWRDYFNNPLIPAIGFLLFAVVLIGFTKAFSVKRLASRKSKLDARSYTLNATFETGFALLFIFSFITLAIATPPFSWINSLPRDHFAVLNQLFRFPFTKFSTMASLDFAILFAVGIQQFFYRFESRIKNQESRKKSSTPTTLLLTSCFLLLLIVFTLPAFHGHLFYDKERVVLPEEYNQLFAFFDNQDPASRIANFPMDNYWGWSFYKWNYSGSGFLWYGIRQPVLDRAFDVWSQTDENYYFEASQAVYAKDEKALAAVLQKYQISWVVVDKNIFDPAQNQAPAAAELETLLGQLSDVHLSASFGNIDVYSVAQKNKAANWVFLKQNLPVVNTYNWDSTDQAYQDVGDYSTSPRSPSPSSSPLKGEEIKGVPSPLVGEGQGEGENPIYYYPFRSLFSLKTQKEKEFDMVQTDTAVVIRATFPPHNQPITLTIPSLLQTENKLPVRIETQQSTSGSPLLMLKITPPQLFLDNEQLGKNTNPVLLSFPLPPRSGNKSSYSLNVNGIASYRITNTNSVPGTTYLATKTENALTIYDGNNAIISQLVMLPSFFSRLPELQERSLSIEPNTAEQTVTISIPKIGDGYFAFTPQLQSTRAVQNCDQFRKTSYSLTLTGTGSFVLASKNATACTALLSQTLPHDTGYAIFINDHHIQGRNVRFWLENTKEHYAAIDTYLEADNASYILPPMEPYGQGYAFHFDNEAIGADETVNGVDHFAAYPPPYHFLQEIKLVSQSMQVHSSSFTVRSPLSVFHPNPSLYLVSLTPNPYTLTPTLILSQSYDPGWKAFQVQSAKCKVQSFLCSLLPFLFGAEVKEHVMVNNWENGWQLNNYPLNPNPYTLIVVYLPQYLQYLGFLLLGATLLYVIIHPRF